MREITAGEFLRQQHRCREQIERRSAFARVPRGYGTARRIPARRDGFVSSGLRIRLLLSTPSPHVDGANPTLLAR
jgi:hypothetical protein